MRRLLSTICFVAITACFVYAQPPPDRYVASFTQSGVNAPVVTVAENTFSGTIVWTRLGPGFYQGHLTGAFTGQVICFPSNTVVTDEEDQTTLVYLSRIDNDNVALQSVDAGAIAKDLNVSSSVRALAIEIRAYAP